MEIKHENQLYSERIAIQLQTMQEIGREIHDNVGQKLTLASIYSNQVTQSNPFENDRLAEVTKLIDQSLLDLRKLSKSLVNNDFKEKSLQELLEDEAHLINLSGTMKLKIICATKSIKLDFKLKQGIFRILQEFIQNSLKHSGGKLITIQINESKSSLEIFSWDDGKGFDLDKISEGIGLSNIKRRAKELNASLEYSSEIGIGTKLNIILEL
ncbi:sensor histidine kinase [Lacihabitans soyangensis]|nr:ATP-binding protein [Lacihabitans soyangensis]